VQASVVIFVGFVVGSYGEVNFTTLGVVYGVLSSFFVALYGIYVRKIIEVVDKDEQRLIIYNTVLSIFGLLPLVYFSGEVGQIMANPLIYDSKFWFMMTLAGVAGLLINTATYLQIKFTSPLTHAISGTAKACVQTILGVMIYQNPISLMNGIGILLVIAGSFLYSYVRFSEMKK